MACDWRDFLSLAADAKNGGIWCTWNDFIWNDSILYVKSLSRSNYVPY